MEKITVAQIMKKKPCPEYTEEIVTDLVGDDKTLMELLDLDIPMSDRIWVTTQFLDDKTNREFAIWCARQCETDIIEITKYIDTIEKYYAGEATDEELMAAYWAASSAACWAASSAASSAACWAASSAADRAACWAADRAADRAAGRAADRAADRAACWAADRAADRAAGRAAERKKQIEKLKQLIGRV
jgi:hypothetical protein